MIRTSLPQRGLSSKSNEKLLRELNEYLHEMSQPMTVLLCAMEYGAGLDSMQELKEMMRISQDACDRLRKNVSAMQSAVREEIGERHR